MKISSRFRPGISLNAFFRPSATSAWFPYLRKIRITSDDCKFSFHRGGNYTFARSLSIHQSQARVGLGTGRYWQMLIPCLKGFINSYWDLPWRRLPSAIPQLTVQHQHPFFSSGIRSRYGILWPELRRIRLPRDMVNFGYGMEIKYL